MSLWMLQTKTSHLLQTKTSHLLQTKTSHLWKVSYTIILLGWWYTDVFRCVWTWHKIDPVRHSIFSSKHFLHICPKNNDNKQLHFVLIKSIFIWVNSYLQETNIWKKMQNTCTCRAKDLPPTFYMLHLFVNSYCSKNSSSEVLIAAVLWHTCLYHRMTS